VRSVLQLSAARDACFVSGQSRPDFPTAGSSFILRQPLVCAIPNIRNGDACRVHGRRESRAVIAGRGAQVKPEPDRRRFFRFVFAGARTGLDGSGESNAGYHPASAGTAARDAQWNDGYLAKRVAKWIGTVGVAYRTITN
jgi:hypothetical protein